MTRRRFSFPLKLCLALVVFAALTYLTRNLWLPLAGYALIHSEKPEKADIVVVLAGDPYGHRLVKAAQLIQAGYTSTALVSGPPGMYGVNESDLALQFIVRQGYPAQWFIPFPDPSHSTKEEAGCVLRELQTRNVHSFLLVTSDFHSARARRIYLAAEHAMGYAPTFRTVTAPDEFFHADSWWHNREAQKTVFIEWSKTLATALGK